jgi:hypothetical protein
LDLIYNLWNFLSWIFLKIEDPRSVCCPGLPPPKGKARTFYSSFSPLVPDNPISRYISTDSKWLETMAPSAQAKTSLLDSSFPVFVPANSIVKASSEEFERCIHDDLSASNESPRRVWKSLRDGSYKRSIDLVADQKKKRNIGHPAGQAREREASPNNTDTLAALKLGSEKGDDRFTVVSETISSYVDVDHDASMDYDSSMAAGIKEPNENAKVPSESGHPLVDALYGAITQDESIVEYPDKKMLTENRGIAYRSTNSAPLDLFTELEQSISDA